MTEKTEAQSTDADKTSLETQIVEYLLHNFAFQNDSLKPTHVIDHLDVDRSEAYSAIENAVADDGIPVVRYGDGRTGHLYLRDYDDTAQYLAEKGSDRQLGDSSRF